MMRSSGREMELNWTRLYSDGEPLLLSPVIAPTVEDIQNFVGLRKTLELES